MQIHDASVTAVSTVEHKRAARRGRGDTPGTSQGLYGCSLGGSGILKEAPGNFRDTHGGGSLELRYRRLRRAGGGPFWEMRCDAFRRAHGASLEMHCGRLRGPEGASGNHTREQSGKGGWRRGGEGGL